MSDRFGGSVHDFVLRLGTRRLLLMLDNAEHLTLPVRALVERLITETEGVRILVTSRRALGGAAEHLFRVPPLSTPASTTESLSECDSVELFADRALRRDADFELERSRPSVELICRVLEGIPLAIELAAARAAIFSPEEIAQQFHPLTLIDEHAPQRQHRSLRDSISWSYELLPPEARVVLRRLALFSSGWTRPAAITVVGCPNFVVLEALATLLAHSLVDRSRDARGQARFSMLETVREFAEELLLAADERDAVAIRYREHYRDLLARRLPLLKTKAYADALAELSVEDANIERALEVGRTLAQSDSETAAEHSRLIIALVPYWHLSGRDNGAVRHLSQVIDLLEDRLPPDLLGRLLLARGRFYYIRGFANAERDLARAVALLDTVDPHEHTRAVASLGAVSSSLLHFNDAERHLQVALRRFETAAEPAEVCTTLTYLADLRFKQSRMDEADEAAQRAETIARELGDPIQLGVLLLIRASIAWARGALERSVDLHVECLDVTEGAPLLSSRALCHANLGNVYAAMKQRDAAQCHWAVAERLTRALGEDVRRALYLIKMAENLPPAERVSVLEDGLETFVRFGHDRNTVAVLFELADTFLLLGEPAAAAYMLSVGSAASAARGIVLPPPVRIDVEASIARAREALPSPEFDAIWSASSEVSLEQALTWVKSRSHSARPRSGTPPML